MLIEIEKENESMDDEIANIDNNLQDSRL
jgi:hypothetical protein